MRESQTSLRVCVWGGPRESEKKFTVTSFPAWHGTGSLLPVFSSHHGKAAHTRTLYWSKPSFSADPESLEIEVQILLPSFCRGGEKQSAWGKAVNKEVVMSSLG